MRENWKSTQALIPAIYGRALRTLGVQNKLSPRRLPSVEVTDFAPDDISTKVLEPFPAATGGNVSALELIIIAKLAQIIRGRVLFEIGTFDGRTTLNLAANSPEGAVVYTLDLPKDQLNSTKFGVGPDEINYVKKEPECIGNRFANSPYRKRIVQLLGDSAAFDFTPFYQGVDLVFVDGSHTYAHVLNDSRIALALLRPGSGIILWHDYDWGYGGAAKALEELCQTPEYKNLKYIRGTTLAYLSRLHLHPEKSENPLIAD
jgi:predicted O-methyltransferase YrrM